MRSASMRSTATVAHATMLKPPVSALGVPARLALRRSIVTLDAASARRSVESLICGTVTAINAPVGSSSAVASNSASSVTPEASVTRRPVAP